MWICKICFGKVANALHGLAGSLAGLPYDVLRTALHVCCMCLVRCFGRLPYEVLHTTTFGQQPSLSESVAISGIRFLYVYIASFYFFSVPCIGPSLLDRTFTFTFALLCAMRSMLQSQIIMSAMLQAEIIARLLRSIWRQCYATVCFPLDISLPVTDLLCIAIVCVFSLLFLVCVAALLQSRLIKAANTGNTTEHP